MAGYAIRPFLAPRFFSGVRSAKRYNITVPLAAQRCTSQEFRRRARSRRCSFPRPY
jgi:hypothetical protein